MLFSIQNELISNIFQLLIFNFFIKIFSYFPGVRFPDNDGRPTSPISGVDMDRTSESKDSNKKDSRRKSDASGMKNASDAKSRRKSVANVDNTKNTPKILIPKIKTNRMASKVKAILF